MTEKRREMVRAAHHSGEEVAIPLGTLVSAHPGPTFAVTAGMHGGEYCGVLAAIRLFQELDPAHLSGTLLVVPVISTKAFMLRNMQLAPVDEKELRYQLPGNPHGTYSELHIDVLYDIVKGATYLIDLHGGEFVQSLVPWVSVPMAGDEATTRASIRLAVASTCLTWTCALLGKRFRPGACSWRNAASPIAGPRSVPTGWSRRTA